MVHILASDFNPKVGGSTAIQIVVHILVSDFNPKVGGGTAIQIVVHILASDFQSIHQEFCLCFISELFWQASKSTFTIGNNPPIHRTCGYIAKSISNTNTASYGR